MIARRAVNQRRQTFANIALIFNNRGFDDLLIRLTHRRNAPTCVLKNELGLDPELRKAYIDLRPESPPVWAAD